MIPVENNNSQVYEMVLFSVKESELNRFTQLNKDVLKHLGSFNGHIASNTFQSVHNPLNFLDVVLWEDLESAEKAAEKFETDPVCLPYMSSIETLLFNEHLETFENSIINYDKIESDDILEVVLYYINHGAETGFLDSRKVTMDHIHAEYPGFRGIKTLKSCKTGEAFIDLPVWSSADLCKKAQKELMNDPTFGAMMQNLNMEKAPIMELMRKVR